MNYIHKGDMRPLPPFPALRAFESAGRLLGFTRAAEELCVTPSAISHQVKLLEGWLGVKLFERAGRQITLTPRGRELYLTAGKCLDDLSIAFRVARHRGTRRDRQRLHVCADAGFVELWLAKRLPDLLTQAPELAIEVSWGSGAEDYKKFRPDIVLHYGRADGLPYERVSQWRFHEFAVCSAALIQRVGSLSNVTDLLHAPLLHERSTEFWMHWLTWAGLQDVEGAERGPIYPCASTCLQAAVSGLGVALVDELVAGDLLVSGQLVKPLGDVRNSDYALTLLAGKDVWTDGAAVSFIRALRLAIDQYQMSAQVFAQSLPYSANATSRSKLRPASTVRGKGKRGRND